MAIKDRRSTIQSIAWMRDMYRSDQLDLDPPYQRRSVWNRSFKQFFIDTILRNYPIPPIFINVEVLRDGYSVYHVVDGKQRLLSILEFLDDKFAVSGESYSAPDVAGKYFSELDSAIQRGIYSYFLPIEFFTELTSGDVTEIFDRFNRNVQRLNKQELRHARYGGAFITLMEQLSDEPIWDDLRLFGRADRRRMRDVEYVSLIFSLTMHGVEDGDDLDWWYAEYDEEIPDVGDALEKYGATRLMVLKLQEVIRRTRLRNRADFYSLWSALSGFADNPDAIDYERTAERLDEFAASVDEVPNLPDPAEASEDALSYSQAVRAGSAKGPNRQRRRELLVKCIVKK